MNSPGVLALGVYGRLTVPDDESAPGRRNGPEIEVSEIDTLRLVEDELAPGGGYTDPLPPLPRVLYVLAGEIIVQSATGDVRVGMGTAWHGSAECRARAGPTGGRLLRYELCRAARSEAEPPESRRVSTRVLLEHPIALNPDERYLMRADRVDFAPGGVALPHRHRGGGIRCLIAGALDVTVGGAAPFLVKPGQAWFESGREPVYAAASPTEPTSFIRVSILPRAIRGQSSIMYVDPADATRGAPRKYTVFVDEPIEVA